MLRFASEWVSPTFKLWVVNAHDAQKPSLICSRGKKREQINAKGTGEDATVTALREFTVYKDRMRVKKNNSINFYEVLSMCQAPLYVCQIIYNTYVSQQFPEEGTIIVPRFTYEQTEAN